MIGEGSPQGIGNGSLVGHNPRGSKISSGTPSPGKGAHSDFLLSPLRTLLDSIVPPSTFPPYPGVPGFLRNIKGTRSPPKVFCYPFTLVPGFLLRMSPKFLPLLSNTSPISQVPEKAWRARSPSWTSFVTDTHTHTHTHDLMIEVGAPATKRL